VVGLGTQDSLPEARDFVTSYGTTFLMLWEDGNQSWRRLRISGQPAAILVDGGGRELKRWFGAFDEAEVLRLTQR
jgi:hypothetical protein